MEVFCAHAPEQLNVKMPSGKFPIHVAAEHNYTTIINLLAAQVLKELHHMSWAVVSQLAIFVYGIFCLHGVVVYSLWFESRSCNFAPSEFCCIHENIARVELSTAFRDVSRCYARENISARRFARGVHIARSFVELRRDA